MTDKNTQIITARVNEIRTLLKDSNVDFDIKYWENDVTYVAGFGDMAHSTTRFTIWVNTKAMFFDYGNIYADQKRLTTLFTKAGENGYTVQGINKKTERRYKTSYEDGIALIKALFSKPKTKGKDTTQKAQEKPKTTSKGNTTKKAEKAS